MSRYPKKPYEIGFGSAALYPGRTLNHVIVAKADLPCNTIVIHGVNDVGVSYGAVEAGLCAGMTKRLALPDGAFVPNEYRNFTDADRDRLEDDPDAIFFKRVATPKAHSFAIPFYWGFREETKPVKTKGGQYTDRYGNRLDKDYSKEGGPFANATNSLPDMWNKGFSGAYGVIDYMSHDPLRPVNDAPGHMYMVLAAQRLAALVQMIRDYDADETVNIVAHSQGCMVSLLAQAFLLQDGRKPVDALVMNNPPYSLEDALPALEGAGAMFKGGTDPRMEKEGDYGTIAGDQTLHARLQTLANIVQGVAANRHTTPAFQSLQGPGGCTVGTKWAPGADRDNRGKVYLYFCPEDATVALNVMRGIGWQGVPDFKTGNKLEPDGTNVWGQPQFKAKQTELKPLSTIGPHFFQRVFTKRLRAPAKGGAPAPVLVGAPAPYDFAFCLEGEENYGHVNADSRTRRGEVEPTEWPVKDKWFGLVPKPEDQRREGIRTITGEALATPVKPDLDGGAVPGSDGKDERPDGIDASTAVTSDYGQRDVWQVIPDPHGAGTPVDAWRVSPGPATYAGPVAEAEPGASAQAAAVINAGKTRPTQMREIVNVFRCLRQPNPYAKPVPIGQWLVQCKESPDEARLRWQHGTVSRSFHSAIFCSAFNHEHVTAYDLAIGQGKAVSNPHFRAYLCAVADWRLKRLATPGKDKARPGILTWDKFLGSFADYYCTEPAERKALIEGTCHYYSTGVLPDFLPVLPGGLPPAVVCETSLARRMEPCMVKPTPKPAENKCEASDSFGEGLT
ncbi:MAG TPA: DUF3274 domain-containing protein [Burkholderiaceae bacterium]